jgi:hypothetical protein
LERRRVGTNVLTSSRRLLALDFFDRGIVINGKNPLRLIPSSSSVGYPLYIRGRGLT